MFELQATSPTDDGRKYKEEEEENKSHLMRR